MSQKATMMDGFDAFTRAGVGVRCVQLCLKGVKEIGTAVISNKKNKEIFI